MTAFAPSLLVSPFSFTPLLSPSSPSLRIRFSLPLKPSFLPKMSATTPTTPSHPPSLSSSSSPSFLIRRQKLFLTMLLSYAIYYVSRFSFPFAAPLMPLSLPQIGVITSIFPFFYAFSKLFAGTLADLYSPRILLALGLCLVALANFLFALGNTSVAYFATCWAFNGIASSVGFPACAKLLQTWFSPKERGTYWGLLNISLNIGGGISPIIVGTAASKLGWRFGMLIPAAMALVMAAVAYGLVADSPAQAGYASQMGLPVEQAANKEKGKGGSGIAVFWTHLREGVLCEHAVWLLAGAYFFVYVIRQALTSWTVFYLMQGRGVKTLVEAGVRVSGLELGGLLGSLSSGWLSDWMVRRDERKGVIGQRVKVILLYLVILVIGLTGFFYVPVTKGLLGVQWGMFATAGFGLYGPQLLVGLSGTECVERRYAGTSNGFVGLLAYGGAALAGFPMTVCVNKFGWQSLFGLVVGCCGLIAIMLLPLLGKQSYEQIEAERKVV